MTGIKRWTRQALAGAMFLMCTLLAGGAHAGPCIPGPLTSYLTPGFSCGVANDSWTFFGFDFRRRSYPDTTAAPQAEDFFVVPFGDFESAGLTFMIQAPHNGVPGGSGQFYQADVDFTVQGSRKISTASLSVVNGVSGFTRPYPEADLLSESMMWVFLCPGSIQLGSQCPDRVDLLHSNVSGQVYIDDPRVEFDPSYLVDTTSIAQLSGGSEFPGGARLDSWTVRFTTPTPSSASLIALALCALVLARSRHERGARARFRAA